MYYTNVFIIILVIQILLLTGCATSPSTGLTSDSLSNVQRMENGSSKRTGEEITLYRQAITDLNNNNLESAKTSFLEINRMQPDLAGPLANLALIYIKQEKFDKADINLQKTLENNPNMAQALNMAGYLESRKGNINRAIFFYEKAINNKPDYALAHYNLALLYDTYLQNIPKAVMHYEKYLILIGKEDEKTKNWVEELKTLIKSENT